MRLEDLVRKPQAILPRLNYGVGTGLQCCHDGSFEIVRGSELCGDNGRFLRTFPNFGATY